MPCLVLQAENCMIFQALDLVLDRQAIVSVRSTVRPGPKAIRSKIDLLPSGTIVVDPVAGATQSVITFGGGMPWA
jgi:hypothetical protein